MTLVIVPCGSAKVWDTHPDAGSTSARDAYTGSPFKVNRAYAEHFADDWVILSAKYGFLRPEDGIPESYSISFKRRYPAPIASTELRRQVRDRCLDRFSIVVGLGGQAYRGRIEEAFEGTAAKLVFPFAGMTLGVSLGAAKRAIAAGRPY